MFNRKPKIQRMLEKHPGHMLVSDTAIAVMLPDGRMLGIKGDFKNISEEDANLKIQQALTDLQ